MKSVSDNKQGRCPWCGTDPLYVAYHDTVWGRPEYDSQHLFEKLCLDGQQAGLSWITILRKQDGYQKAFAGFDPERVARFTDDDVEALMNNPEIVRNRLKIRSIIGNARAYLQLEQDTGESFSRFLWSFVDHHPIQNQWATMAQVPTTDANAIAMSKALKKRGFSFVGPTIVYAFMQATGFVNDHLVACPQHGPVRDLA